MGVRVVFVATRVPVSGAWAYGTRGDGVDVPGTGSSCMVGVRRR